MLSENDQPIHKVTQWGILSAVKAHLQKGVDPNEPNDWCCTSLHFATSLNYAEIVELLLEWHANPNLQDCEGLTPLHDAALKGYTKIVELLLKWDANPNVQDYLNYTPIYYAISKGHAKIVELLLEWRANPNAQTTRGYTPLYCAILNNQIEIAVKLLEAGAILKEGIDVDDSLKTHTLNEIIQKSSSTQAKLFLQQLQSNLNFQDHSTCMKFSQLETIVRAKTKATEIEEAKIEAIQKRCENGISRKDIQAWLNLRSDQREFCIAITSGSYQEVNMNSDARHHPFFTLPHEMRERIIEEWLLALSGLSLQKIRKISLFFNQTEPTPIDGVTFTRQKIYHSAPGIIALLPYPSWGLSSIIGQVFAGFWRKIEGFFRNPGYCDKMEAMQPAEAGNAGRRNAVYRGYISTGTR